MTNETKTKITATKEKARTARRNAFESIAFTVIGWLVVFGTETLLRGKASDFVCSFLDVSGASLAALGPGVKLVARFFPFGKRAVEVEKVERKEDET